MTYADKRYILIAKKNELYHHDREMDQLRLQIEQLSRTVAWEIKQHQARIQELQNLEDALNAAPPKDNTPTHITLKPIIDAEQEQRVPKDKPESKRRRTHRQKEDESAELVS